MANVLPGGGGGAGLFSFLQDTVNSINENKAAYLSIGKNTGNINKDKMLGKFSIVPV